MIVSSPTSTDCVVIDSDDVYDTAEIADIEHMTDVSIGASEYTHDIYKYLRQAEVILYLFHIVIRDKPSAPYRPQYISI